MGGGRQAVVVLAVLACALAGAAAFPGVALGDTTVLEVGGSALIQADPGEANDVTVTSSRLCDTCSYFWVITDTQQLVTLPGGACRAAPTLAVCPAAADLAIATRDLNDRVTIATDVYEHAIVCAGSGDDTVTGGPLG